ncbi:hypothetical protein SNEBB_001378 [Seison nebaliae]|nr:hypothetical protein SNEBB_001378 [Seison nebaliae]
MNDAYNELEEIQLDREKIFKRIGIAKKFSDPIPFMLGYPCKSFEQITKKCEGGMLVEKKYDGERIQIHLAAQQTRLFTRSMKMIRSKKFWLFPRTGPKKSWKEFQIRATEEYLSYFCPKADKLVLEAEYLLIDKISFKYIAFNELEKHRRNNFRNIDILIVIFDILKLDNELLLHKPQIERRRILEDISNTIPNKIILSERFHASNSNELENLLRRMKSEDGEGLMIKDNNLPYESGKRLWMKMKINSLESGAMADNVDLILLGVYLQEENVNLKKIIYEKFLLGCFDRQNGCWVTVLQCEDVNKIIRSKKLKKLKFSPFNQISYNIDIHPQIIPTLLIDNPKTSIVLEVSGQAFWKNNQFSANNISIKLPKIQRVRTDKNWETATTLFHLQNLYNSSL